MSALAITASRRERSTADSSARMSSDCIGPGPPNGYGPFMAGRSCAGSQSHVRQAEGEGLEPPRALQPAGFQDRCGSSRPIASRCVPLSERPSGLRSIATVRGYCAAAVSNLCPAAVGATSERRCSFTSAGLWPSASQDVTRRCRRSCIVQSAGSFARFAALATARRNEWTRAARCPPWQLQHRAAGEEWRTARRGCRQSASLVALRAGAGWDSSLARFSCPGRIDIV
jgi:hypothetical protein